MPTLSDKLRSLGVKVGAGSLPPPRPRPAGAAAAYPAEAVGGRALGTSQGETVVIDSHYPETYLHGRAGLLTSAPLNILAAWARDDRINTCSPQSFGFLDTETTGLSGGAGTYAFLVGVGRFEDNQFHLAQFFMRDPLEEPGLLAAVEDFLAPCQAIVTFNGKAFDLPLLVTRYTTHGWRTPFRDLAHVDLLHLARRLWRDRLPSRTLGNLEYQILGTTRSEADVPGWMIPQMYFDYLRSGDPEPMKRVIYHNAIDVVSMAALLNHMSRLLADPFNAEVEHGADLIALAKLYEDLGHLETAARLYLHGLDHDLPHGILLDAIQRLAALHKRQENWAAAVELWEKAAHYGCLPAYIELAKYYEHRQRDYQAALAWTQGAILVVSDPTFPPSERRQWLLELEHRVERLERLANRPSSKSPVQDDIIPPVSPTE